MDDAAADLTTPFELFLVRVWQHHQRLRDGADPLDVDVAIIAELAKLLHPVGIPLPSAAFLRAHSVVLDGGNPAYLNRRKGKRPALMARQFLIGNAAHLVEVMTAGKVFGVAAAAQQVAAAFNAAGFPPPKRAGGFTARAVEDWHAFVVHKAKAADPARDLFTMQQKVVQRTHQGYRQWNAEQLKEWLRHSIRDMARLGYFEATKPG
jgi:hypothetical protein